MTHQEQTLDTEKIDNKNTSCHMCGDLTIATLKFLELYNILKGKDEVDDTLETNKDNIIGKEQIPQVFKRALEFHKFRMMFCEDSQGNPVKGLPFPDDI